MIRQKEYCENGEKIGRNLMKNLFNNTDKYRFYFSDYKFDEVDFIMMNLKDSKIYAGDIKAYRNPDYPRNSDKFHDYQIDYSKLEFIEDRAKMINATPILVVFFTDKTVIWDLNKIDWKTNTQIKLTNSKGGLYGLKKDNNLQAYLNLDEAIYTKINTWTNNTLYD